MCDAEGPYDVVILDMALSQLVLALMQVSFFFCPTCNLSLGFDWHVHVFICDNRACYKSCGLLLLSDAAAPYPLPPSF